MTNQSKERLSALEVDLIEEDETEPKAQTFAIYIYYVHHDGVGGRFYPSTSDGMEAHGWVLVKKVDLAVDIPADFDPRPKLIELLRQQQDQVRAEMSKRITELQNQINKLQALEMSE